MIALDPDFGILEVAQQRPMACPVPPPDTTALRHHGEELDGIRLA